MGEDLDIIHEGRISKLEAKMDRALPMIEDLHTDLIHRKARWEFITGGFKYVAWLMAGVTTLLGLSKTQGFAAWLQSFPHH